MRSLVGAVVLLGMKAAAAVSEVDAAHTPQLVVGMSEAVELARTKLMTGYALVGPQVVPPQEYLFSRATYTKDRQGIWYWEITFAHPMRTDYTAQYRVSMDGTASLYDSGPSPDDLAPTKSCNMDEYEDQLRMNLCSDHNYKLIDAELNYVYQEKMSQFKDDSNRSDLRKSQRGWLKSTQKYCDQDIGPRQEGGTSWPMLMNICEIDRITARIRFLKSCTDSGCPLEQP